MELVRQATGPLLVAFMVGNLLGLGLELAAGDARRALRNARFVACTVTWGWLLGPALAWLVVKAVPMEPGYATGLLLLALAPGAPFVPPFASKAGGEASYVGAVMLLTAVGTVIVMPLAVPVFVPGLTADAWMIGKPLLLYVLLPLIVGMAVRTTNERLALAMRPLVKTATTVATLLMLVAVFAVYGKAMAGAIGSFAIASQVLYFGLLFVGAYLLAPGLAHGPRVVLSLAMGTRNIGAAFAPLLAAPDADSRAVVMCAIATLVTVALAAVAAKQFSRGT